ncbi:hypothetical protein IQ266_25090 [filamentous cyanobacterium LEGE 11480]|uniref:Uncharacterized protein n=1 Tax=Romeriopsis navalis LEGE 11480 TaxID=2777977 RepID=A0A928Z4V3_9CYAN|nr:hypothetical protein [Romeriopsis navalis]MBE9033016.1 hypothetical protein [Romeriopsis navalis LEGE 11480]
MHQINTKTANALIDSVQAGKMLPHDAMRAAEVFATTNQIGKTTVTDILMYSAIGLVCSAAIASPAGLLVGAGGFAASLFQKTASARRRGRELMRMSNTEIAEQLADNDRQILTSLINACPELAESSAANLTAIDLTEPMPGAEYTSYAGGENSAPYETVSMSTIPMPTMVRSLFLHLADNPFICYFILASQRTGKTSSAAAATLAIKREAQTQIFYINLSDHGQGNRAAFVHADKVAIGNINGGEPTAITGLIQDAIVVVEQFHASHNAILVVDEWVSLAAKGRGILDEFWAVLAPKADALTSNGIGCGRAVWAIAPRFQAASMRDEAKVVKNFVPLLLSIAPGQTVEWKNPRNGTVAKLNYNGALVGQAATNWKEAGITEPTPELVRHWQRNRVSRIFWADRQWSALGQPPAMPSPVTVSGVAVPERKVSGGTVAKLERDLQAKSLPPRAVEPEIDLLQICVDKLAVSDRYITLAKLRESLSAAQKRRWDDEFEVLLLEDERVRWVDIPISGGRVSTRLEYIAPDSSCE